MNTRVLFLLPMFLMFFGCSSNNDSEPEKEVLKELTYEVIFFEFTSDTGHNTSRLRYEIKFNNPNKVGVKGTSVLTIDADGIVTTQIKKVPPYTEIGANASFNEKYDVETPLNPNVGITKSIKLVVAKFAISE